jgi:hypothetical protein
MKNELERILKWSWPNLRYHPSICSEGLRAKNLSQDSQSLCRNLNLGPPESKAGVLTSFDPTVIIPPYKINATINSLFI